MRNVSPVVGSTALIRACTARMRAPARSACAVVPYTVVATYSTVRLNRPHGSRRNPEFCITPAIALGCRDCRYNARSPPTTRTGSAWMRQVTDPGPNRPRSSSLLTGRLPGVMGQACHAAVPIVAPGRQPSRCRSSRTGGSPTGPLPDHLPADQAEQDQRDRAGDHPDPVRDRPGLPFTGVDRLGVLGGQRPGSWGLDDQRRSPLRRRWSGRRRSDVPGRCRARRWRGGGPGFGVVRRASPDVVLRRLATSGLVTGIHLTTVPTAACRSELRFARGSSRRRRARDRAP